MPNMKNIMDGHNKSTIEKAKREDNTNSNDGGCNCRNRRDCPLDGACKTKNIVYQATVKTNSTSETYVGLTENAFKTRYANHKSSFNNAAQKNATELSKYIWMLKNDNTNYELSWTILDKARAYSNTNKRCDLCTLEKFYIIYKPEHATLNKRTELLNTCRHSRKYTLKSL